MDNCVHKINYLPPQTHRSQKGVLINRGIYRQHHTGQFITMMLTDITKPFGNNRRITIIFGKSVTSFVYTFRNGKRISNIFDKSVTSFI